MTQPLAKIATKTRQSFRLVPAATGRHRFGGSLPYQGLCPTGSDVPVQLLASLDLTAENVSFQAEPALTRLPLYHPLKYGYGGASMQYGIVSDDEIRILWMDDEQPNEPDSQYVQVDELPSLRLDLIPLAADHVWSGNDLLQCGGEQADIENAGEIICKNPACDHFEQPISFQTIAMISPIPVNGDDEFWYEFQGAYMAFCFVLCQSCGTVITFNVAT